MENKKRERDFDKDDAKPKPASLKKKRMHLLIELKIKVTDGQLIDIVKGWLDEYDPTMVESTPRLRSYINSEMCCNATHFYGHQRTDELLGSDIDLCAHICPIHILHIIADLWAIQPHTSFLSTELGYFFHVLKYHLSDNPSRMNVFVTRLLDLTASYSSNNGGHILASHVPIHNQTALATLYFKNLYFMDQDRHTGIYHKSCNNLRERGAFRDIVMRHTDTCEIDDRAFNLFVKEAFNSIINAWDEFLENRLRSGRRGDIFQKTPVTLKWHREISYKYYNSWS